MPAESACTEAFRALVPQRDTVHSDWMQDIRGVQAGLISVRTLRLKEEYIAKHICQRTKPHVLPISWQSTRLAHLGRP